MAEIRTSELLVAAGQVVADARGRLSAEFTRKWNALVRAVDGIGRPSGRNIRRRELPDQTIVTLDVRARRSVQPDFRLTVQQDGAVTYVSVGFGLVQGFEPQIDGRGITVPDAGGDVPQLLVKASDFGTDGKARIYLEVTSGKAWNITGVAVVALAKTPPKTAWKGYKLLGLLVKDGDSIRTIQAAKRSLGYATSDRKANGFARHWFWAVNA